MSKLDQLTMVLAIIMENYLGKETLNIPKEAFDKFIENDIIGVKTEKHDDHVEVSLVKSSDVDPIEELKILVDELKDLLEK